MPSGLPPCPHSPTRSTAKAGRVPPRDPPGTPGPSDRWERCWSGKARGVACGGLGVHGLRPERESLEQKKGPARGHWEGGETGGWGKGGPQSPFMPSAFLRSSDSTPQFQITGQLAQGSAFHPQSDMACPLLPSASVSPPYPKGRAQRPGGGLSGRSMVSASFLSTISSPNQPPPHSSPPPIFPGLNLPQTPPHPERDK